MSANRLRLAGHGRRLRVKTDGDWNNPDASLAEHRRASVALDKALAASIRRARDAGRSWSQIGRILGVAENAESWPEVRVAMAHSRQVLWDRAFTSDI